MPILILGDRYRYCSDIEKKVETNEATTRPDDGTRRIVLVNEEIIFELFCSANDRNTKRSLQRSTSLCPVGRCKLTLSFFLSPDFLYHVHVHVHLEVVVPYVPYLRWESY